MTRTNHCINPSAEVDTAGWVGENTSSVTRIDTDAVMGSACFRGVRGAGGGEAGLRTGSGNRPAVSEGQEWTVTAQVKSAASVNFQISASFWGGTDGGGGFVNFTLGSQTAMDGTWKLIAHTFTIPSGSVSMIYTVNNQSGTEGDVWLIDAVLATLEPGDYFDGDSDNAEWTGTAHASTSIYTDPPPPVVEAPSTSEERRRKMAFLISSGII